MVQPGLSYKLSNSTTLAFHRSQCLSLPKISPGLGQLEGSLARAPGQPD